MKVRNVSIFKPRRRSKKHHPWLIAITVKGSPRQVTSGSTDYADSLELAGHLSRIAQRIDNKMADPAEMRQEIQRRLPLTKHLNAFEKSLLSSGMTSKHALQMRLYAEESLEQFATVDQIVASEVQEKVFALEVSATTKNRRRYAVVSFLKWGAQDDRWPESVVKRFKVARLTQTKVRPRRVLVLDDLVKLIHVAENGVPVAGCSGKQRALMYRTLIATGLRFGELTRLRVKHLSDGGFNIPADLTKNRKPAIVALPVALGKEIYEFTRGHWSHADADKPIFPVQKFNPDRLLKHDLDVAGIPRTTGAGVFDFHSLRHQCATLLASSGAQAKVVQSHMRHGSAKLTLDTYGHLFDKDRLRAAEVMGKFVQRRAHQAGASMNEQKPTFDMERRGIEPRFAECDSDIDSLIILRRNELYNKRGKRIAPGASARLLRRLHDKAQKRANAGRE